MSEQTSKRHPKPIPPFEPPDVLGGTNPRGEVAGCPTGLSGLDLPTDATPQEEDVEKKPDQPPRDPAQP